MTDLSSVSTEVLRAELAERRSVEREAEEEAFRKRYPCPECGGDPREVDGRVVDEFRFAPCDDDGRPMLWAPYEMGVTKGVLWRTSVTCVNGHITTSDETKWYDNPRPGPPLLA